MLLLAGAASAEDSQPLNDNELKSREATAAAGAVEAAAKAQSAVNAAQLPSTADLSKYRLDAPEVKLDAQAAGLAYKDTGDLVTEIAQAILKAIPATKGSPTPTLLLASARTRALLVQARAVEQSLHATRASLDNMTRVLRNDIAAASTPVPAPVPGTTNARLVALPAAAVLPAISAIGQAGVAFVSALRSSYNMSGVDNTALVSAAFGNRVLGELAGKAEVLQVDAILRGALDQQSSVFKAHAALVASALAARQAVADALDMALQMRAGPLPTGGDDTPGGKQRKAILERADALTAAAVKHNANADTVDKALAGLATPDAQGDSPLDQALRGSQLAARLNADSIYTLSFVLSASKADVVAKNGLISGLKLAIGSHSIATWQLTNADGRIVGSGAGAKATELKQVAKYLFSEPVSPAFP